MVRERQNGYSMLLLGQCAFLCLVLILSAATAHAALVATGLTNGVSAEKIEEFRSNGIPDEQWPALMETLGHDDKVGAVRALIKEQKSFPAAKLVALLGDSKLAVRLGALDLLEDSAGDTFGFDPWQEDPAAGGNAQALERWKSWAEKDGAGAAPTPATLGEENFRSFASEIMSGDRDRSEHAMQRLEGFGVAAIPRIEAFLKSQAGLEGAARAGLKCAEYRIVLRQCLPKEAASLSRNLAFGAPQARSSALAAVSAGGSVALPVIADFLDSPEALVREAAVDAAFKAGEEKADPLIIPRLGSEKAESVLHAMLRGLSLPAAVPGHRAGSRSSFGECRDQRLGSTRQGRRKVRRRRNKKQFPPHSRRGWVIRAGGFAPRRSRRSATSPSEISPNKSRNGWMTKTVSCASPRRKR